MNAALVTQVTIGVCLISALAEASLVCTATPRLSFMDVPIVLFIVGPFLCFATGAWLQRDKLAGSWTLLAIVICLSAWGLYILGEDSHRYHTEANYRKLQRMAPFFVPLVQYAAVVLAGTASLLSHLSSLAKRPSPQAEPGNAREPRQSPPPGS